MAPILRGALKYVVAPVVAAHLVARILTGCVGLHNVDEVNNPADDLALAECRKEMRKARDAGAAPQAAYDVYHDCTVEAGLR